MIFNCNTEPILANEKSQKDGLYFPAVWKKRAWKGIPEETFELKKYIFYH